MSSEEPTILLGHNPTIQFQKWWIQLQEFISVQCNQHLGPRGFLNINYHLTDEEYAALPPNLDAAGAPIIPNVRPIFQTHPLAGNAGQMAALKQENTKAIDINLGIAKIRSFAIRSAGSEVTDEISDPASGLTNVTFHQLLHHVKSTYGVLTAADVSVLRDSLLKWDSARTVKGNLLHFQQTHLTLSNAGYPLNEDTKIANLSQATRSNMAIQEIFKLYRIDQPVLLLQTYDALKAKIVLHEPGFTATQAGYAAANAASALAATTMQADFEAKLAAQAKDFRKQMSEMKSQFQASPKKPDYDDPARKLVKEYCDAHGNLCYQCYGGNKTETPFVDCKRHYNQRGNRRNVK